MLSIPNRLALALLCSLLATDALAGAWTQERGDVLVIARTGATRATTAFDDEGALVGPRDFRKIEGSLYVEYGLRPSITLIAAPTVQSIHDEGRAGTGLAFTDLGARVRIYQGTRDVISLQSLFIAPGTLKGSDNAVLASGNLDVELRALYGRSFSLLRRKGFLGIEAGYRRRGGGLQNEWRADATLGFTMTKRLTVLTQTFSIVGDDGYMLHKLQTSSVYALSPRVSLETGYVQAVFGRSVVAERGAFFAVWMRF